MHMEGKQAWIACITFCQAKSWAAVVKYIADAQSIAWSPREAIATA